MKRSTFAAIGGAAFGLAGGATAAALVAAWRRRDLGGELPHETVHWKADSLDYRPVTEGAYRAVLWGDPDQGPYAGFTRFDPGVRHPLHKHTHDILIVVLDGVYLYQTERGEQRVGERECIFIPGGDVHKSGGDDTKGCLFFELASGSFDLQLVE
jgi:quercetin dioxygenase-like cupin family protein